MLRTNNKQVKFDLDAHVLENFWPKNYGGGTVGLQNLVDQIDAMRHNDRTIYQTAIDYVEGGSYLVYYYDVKDFLQKLLKETDEERARYSDEKAWHLYCHLVARHISQLYDRRQEELKRLAHLS